MITRRRLLRAGLGAFGLGLLSRRSGEAAVLRWLSCPESGGLPAVDTNPFAALPRFPNSEWIGGMPFAPWFQGDDFRNDAIPFHSAPQYFPDDTPPEPSETVDVAVVGGGIAGLASGYLLREHRTVVFELHPRFGGNAQGETWRGIPFSIGSAYVIVPDKGSFLESFYRELGLRRVARESFPPDPTEYQGRFFEDFEHEADLSAAERAAFARYGEVVQYMANEAYPEIPLPDDPAEVQRILAMDEITFLEDVEQRMGMPLTPLLAQGIQAYFHSSFNAGMDAVSAASGWNFVAAEEFGRWVFPGGNARLVYEMWRRLRALDRRVPPECRPYHLRGGCRVIDVRKRGDDAQVTYLDAKQQVRSLIARTVVMACPKHVAKNVLHDLENWDPEKRDACFRVFTSPYLVANVLLEAPVRRDFYDCFLLGNGDYPMSDYEFELNPRVADLLRGDYADRGRPPRSVLTLYWPLPWGTARFSLIMGDPWRHYAELLVPQLRRMLEVLEVPASAVRQIRMARWGHSMPIARPRFMVDGTAAMVQRPLHGRIFFVNQDNWALPAVENTLEDARRVAETIEGIL